MIRNKMGFGLNVVKSLCDSLNIEVRVLSKEGVGTGFELLLPPLEERKEVDLLSPRAKAKPVNFSHNLKIPDLDALHNKIELQVLIVEDNPFVSLGLKTLLKVRFDIEAFTANHGKDCVD